MQEQNELRVLRLIADTQGIAQAQIAIYTKLNKMTVSRIVRNLIKKGYIAQKTDIKPFYYECYKSGYDLLQETIGGSMAPQPVIENKSITPHTKKPLIHLHALTLSASIYKVPEISIGWDYEAMIKKRIKKSIAYWKNVTVQSHSDKTMTFHIHDIEGESTDNIIAIAMKVARGIYDIYTNLGYELGDLRIKDKSISTINPRTELKAHWETPDPVAKAYVQNHGSIQTENGHADGSVYAGEIGYDTAEEMDRYFATPRRVEQMMGDIEAIKRDIGSLTTAMGEIVQGMGGMAKVVGDMGQGMAQITQGITSIAESMTKLANALNPTQPSPNEPQKPSKPDDSSMFA